MKNNLRGLPLTAEICEELLGFFRRWPEPLWIAQEAPVHDTPRQLVLSFIGDVPDDDRFWGGLGMAEQIEQESHGFYSAAEIAEQYFSGSDGSFEKHYNFPPPPEWREPAAKVLLVLDVLRVGATLATKPGHPIEDEPKSAIERRRKHEENKKKFKETPLKKIKTERNNLPKTLRKVPSLWIEEIAKIIEKVLAPYLTLKNNYRGTVAREIKSKMDRQLSQLRR